MAKRRNKENQGLPRRWQYRHGAYYYQVPPGLEKLWDGKKVFRLGRSLPEAFKEYAKRIEAGERAKTIADILDRYALEVIPTKAAKTQKDNIMQCARLRKVFGEMFVHSIEPHHIYQYYDKREAKVAAKREIALLSHVYTKAVQWGAIKRHPFKGQVRLPGERPRERYIEDWEIIEALSLQAERRGSAVPAIQAFISLVLITGLRKGDTLRIRESDIKEDGLYVKIGKTGKRVILTWNEDLRDTIDTAKRLRPVHISPYLFCTRRGECYVNGNDETPGWNSMWQRFMDKLLAETRLKESFTMHDLRAKAGSDQPDDEQARKLLTHESVALTRKHYRRKPQKIVLSKK